MLQWIAKLAKKVRSARPRPSREAVFCDRQAAVESLEDRRLLSADLTHGIVVNTLSSSNYNATLNMLHDTGTRSVRMWVSVNNFNSRSTDGSFKYITKLHNAGIDITLSVVPTNSGVRGSYDQVYNYFNWLDGQLGYAANRWEIGNEPDKVYGGNWNAYVDGILKPAAAALHAHGEKVISGAVSWNPADIKAMVNAGMLNYVDYVGYHPYRITVSDLVNCIAQVKSYVGGKPLVASEWNPRGQTNSASWNSMIQAFWPVIRDNFYAAYYYAAFKSGTMAGAAGIMSNSGGAKNGQYYATYKGLSVGGGSSTVTAAPTPVVKAGAPKPVTTTTAKPVTTKTTTTSEKAPTSKPVKTTKTVAVAAARKPVVTAFRILDARTGKVLKGFENITASESIKATALPTRYIQIEAITSNTSSVRYTFTGQNSHTENNAPFTAFANNSGAATSWFAAKGSYTLHATAYSGKYLGGTKGNNLGIVLTFR